MILPARLLKSQVGQAINPDDRLPYDMKVRLEAQEIVDPVTVLDLLPRFNPAHYVLVSLFFGSYHTVG